MLIMVDKVKMDHIKIILQITTIVSVINIGLSMMGRKGVEMGVDNPVKRKVTITGKGLSYRVDFPLRVAVLFHRLTFIFK